MKKSPGRKERRRLERKMRRENGKQLQHMWIVNQRKAVKAARKELKNGTEADRAGSENQRI